MTRRVRLKLDGSVRERVAFMSMRVVEDMMRRMAQEDEKFDENIDLEENSRQAGSKDRVGCCRR